MTFVVMSTVAKVSLERACTVQAAAHFCWWRPGHEESQVLKLIDNSLILNTKTHKLDKNPISLLVFDILLPRSPQAQPAERDHGLLHIWNVRFDKKARLISNGTETTIFVNIHFTNIVVSVTLLISLAF